MKKKLIKLDKLPDHASAEIQIRLDPGESETAILRRLNLNDRYGIDCAVIGYHLSGNLLSIYADPSERIWRSGTNDLYTLEALV